MSVYESQGTSPNTLTSGGTAFFSWSHARCRFVVDTAPAGYDANRIHFPDTSALSRSNWPTKNGMSTRSWELAAPNDPSAALGIDVANFQSGSARTVTDAGKRNGR